MCSSDLFCAFPFDLFQDLFIEPLDDEDRIIPSLQRHAEMEGEVRRSGNSRDAQGSEIVPGHSPIQVGKEGGFSKARAGSDKKISTFHLFDRPKQGAIHLAPTHKMTPMVSGEFLQEELFLFAFFLFEAVFQSPDLFLHEGESVLRALLMVGKFQGSISIERHRVLAGVFVEQQIQKGRFFSVPLQQGHQEGKKRNVLFLADRAQEGPS